MAATSAIVEADTKRLVFRVGEHQHQIDAAQVMEVVMATHITRVPHGPDALVGIMNLRGKPLPILSMKSVLHGDHARAPFEGKIIVYDHAVALGLLVDDVMRLSKDTGSHPIDGLASHLDAAFKQTRLTKVDRARHRLSVSEPEKTSRIIALLSFRIAGQLYALPLADVREVNVFSTDKVSAVANNASAVIGIFPSRDGVLPIVSLASLLGLEVHEAGHLGSYVVEVEHDGEPIGLVVDEIEVIHRLSEDAIDVVPALLQKGRGDAQIEAIGRVSGTGRLISILSPEKLFAHQDVALALAKNAEAKTIVKKEENRESLEQFLIFQLGEESYGMPVRSVDEVIRVPEDITRIPGAPHFVMGVINLRGKAIPLIDQRTRFDTPSIQQSAKSRAIVLTLGRLQAGFVVDEVSEVKAISSSALSEAPDFSSTEADVFDRVAHIEQDGRMILLIDPQELLTRAEQDVIAAIGDGETRTVRA
jgi:purine-binding chemotaxis protein CheW